MSTIVVPVRLHRRYSKPADSRVALSATILTQAVPGGVLLVRRTLLVALISTILVLAGSAFPQKASVPKQQEKAVLATSWKSENDTGATTACGSVQ